MRSTGFSTVKASTTGARRSSDCSSASTYTRPMVSCAGPSMPLAPATAMSRNVSSSDQGLKSSEPTVTVRPSCSLARRSSGPLTSAGTESHDRAHTPSSAASARAGGLEPTALPQAGELGVAQQGAQGGWHGRSEQKSWLGRGTPPWVPSPLLGSTQQGNPKVTGAGLASGFQGIQMWIVLSGQSPAPHCGWWRT